MKKRELYELVAKLVVTNIKLADYNSELRIDIASQRADISTLKARFEIANARHESDLKTITELNAELTELKSKNSTLRKRFAARGQ